MNSINICSLLLSALMLSACATTPPGNFSNIVLSESSAPDNTPWRLEHLAPKSELKISGIELDMHSESGSTYAEFNLYPNMSDEAIVKVKVSDSDCSGEYSIMMGYWKRKNELLAHYFKSTVPWNEQLDLTFAWNDRDLTVTIGENESFNVRLAKKVNIFQTTILSGDLQINSINYSIKEKQ